MATDSNSEDTYHTRTPVMTEVDFSFQRGVIDTAGEWLRSNCLYHYPDSVGTGGKKQVGQSGGMHTILL